jgi:hypothetical protein
MKADPQGVLTPVKFKISNSKGKTYRRCPKKYDYKYVQGLRSKRRSIPMEKGSWCHELLEVFYNGGDWRKAHKKKCKQFKRLFEEERAMLGDLPTECARIMEAYFRQYEEEDLNLRIVDTELNEYITLPNGLRVQVVIDLVYEDQMGLWAMDHKFRGRFEDPMNMRLDPQLTIYDWAAELLGYPLVGVVYNEVLTKPPTIPRLTAKTGKLEKRSNLFTDTHTYAAAVRAHGFDLSDYSDILKVLASRQQDRFFRRTYLPKDPAMVRNAMGELNWTAQEMMEAERLGRFPRTFDRSCKTSCEFMELCLTQYSGGDGSTSIKRNFTRKDDD